MNHAASSATARLNIWARVAPPILALSTFLATPAGAEIVFVGSATGATGNSNTTTVSVSTPLATEIGDLLIATVSTDGNTSATLAPAVLADWNSIDLGTCASDACTLGAWWRFAAAGDAAGGGSHQFTWTGSEQAAASIVAYRGVDPTTPVELPSAGTGTSGTPTAPAITPTIDDTRVVRVTAVDGDRAMVYLGATQRVGLESAGSILHTATVSLAVGDEAHSSSAITSGTRSWQILISSDQWRGLSFALRPDPDEEEVCLFLEDFTRPDSDTVDNGWVETEPAAAAAGIFLGTARLRGTGEPAIDQSVDISTIVNARVTFEWSSSEDPIGFTDSEPLSIFGLADYFRGEFSLDGGATWDLFFETDLGVDLTTFREVISLPWLAQGQTVLLRFEADLTESDEQVYVHSVRVCGDEPATVVVQKQTSPGGAVGDFDFEFSTDGGISFVGASSAAKTADADPQELSLAVPAGVQEDDLLIAFLVLDDDVLSLAPDDGGWSAVGGSPVFSTTGDDFTLAVWTRFATAAEPADYLFAWDVGDDEQAVGGILVYRGVDTTSPIDQFALTALGTAAPPALAPAVTTTVANATVLRFIAIDEVRFVSHPGPSVPRFEVFASLAGGITGAVGEEFQAELGDTGTAAFAYVLNTEWAAMTVALRPERVSSAFQLADDGSESFDVVPQGHHTATEIDPLPAGFLFTNAVCSGGATDNGQEQDEIATAAGETHTCVFTNTITGDLALTKTFLESTVAPGGTLALEFNINNPTAAPATGIAFTDDLDAALAGLVSTSGTLNNICGAGSSIGGTGILTFSGGILAAGDDCTFIVTLSVPANAAPGLETNTTSTLAGTLGTHDTIASVTAAASADFYVVGVPTIAKEFLGTPLRAGETVELEFTLTNPDPTYPATGLFFTDDLTAVLTGLEATDTPQNDICGAGSSISGTTVLAFSDGSLGPGASCTFSVTLSIPEDSEDGVFLNETSILSGSVDGVSAEGAASAVATAELTVTGLSVLEIPTLGEWAFVVLALSLSFVAWRRIGSATGR